MRLPFAAMIAPLWVMIAPMGTSSRSPARFASSIAACMNVRSSVMRHSSINGLQIKFFCASGSHVFQYTLTLRVLETFNFRLIS